VYIDGIGNAGDGMSNSMTFSILLKRENDGYIAHCLELDIVAVSDTMKGANEDIVSLVQAQIEYAFRSNNLDNLYKPAPLSAGEDYFSCSDAVAAEYPMDIGDHPDESPRFFPSTLVMKTCTPDPDRIHAEISPETA